MSSATADLGTSSKPPTRAGQDREIRPALAWTGFLLVLLARGCRAVLVTFLVVSCIPLVSSWTGYVVRSGSMEPGMSIGDVIIAKPLPAGDPIPVGRVMVFDNPDRSSGHTTMVHRVVSYDGRDQYTTRGDANRENDSTPAAKDDFLARPTISVPFIGLPLTWWADRDLRALAFWLTLISLTLYFSVRPPCDPRHRRRREANKARRAAARAAADLKRVSVIAVPLVAVLIAVIAPPTRADAAFSAVTSNRGMTWTASTSLSKTLELTNTPTGVRGTVALSASLNEASGRTFSVRFDYAPAGTTGWQTACTDTTAPYSCSWVTTATSSGQYDLRAVATSGTTTYTSQVVQNVMVDNVAPATTMQDPGTPLRGTITTTATASDAHSGVKSVVIQYAPTGSTTFTDICTQTATPYSCQLDSTTVAGGSYSFRALTTDNVGNSTTSAIVANRVIDNTVSSVSVVDPGPYLAGTVLFKANATSTAGISSVRLQYAPSGTSTWTDLCTDTATPYECSVNTNGLADGLYDLRAVMLDNAGKTTTSASVTGRRVDNNPIRGFDVQTTSGSSAGKPGNNDTMTLTYNKQINLASVSSGWTGSPLAVTVRLRDGELQGLGTTDDTITVLRGAAAVNLGSVNLRQNYIGASQTAEFSATMTTSTTTVNGVTATRVILTLGSQTSGPALPTVTLASVMVWTPSALVTDLNGRAASAGTVSESGASDREF